MVDIGELKDYGFKLVEPDDHVVQLYHRQKLLAVYNQTKVTAEIIKQDCQNYIRNTIRGLNHES